MNSGLMPYQPGKGKHFTFLATPFEFTANFPPETCLQMMRRLTIKPPLLRRLFDRNDFDLNFESIDSDTWEFYLNPRSVKGADASGLLRRRDSESTLISGVAEYNRFVSFGYIIIGCIWVLGSLSFPERPVVLVIIVFIFTAVINLWYMRKVAKKLIKTLQEILGATP